MINFDERNGDEIAFFAEVVDDDGGRHWSEFVYDCGTDADAALTEAKRLWDEHPRRYGPGQMSLQVRGPFVIPGIPPCGMIV